MSAGGREGGREKGREGGTGGFMYLRRWSCSSPPRYQRLTIETLEETDLKQNAMASAAAVASSRREALAMVSPVRSQIIV